jgi:hypothetical protein
MQTELLTYKTFTDLALARNLAAMLDDNGIEYMLDESVPIINRALVSTDKEYYLKIAAGDFTKVQQLQVEYESEFVAEVEADYYLFDFTVAELMEIVTKPDEWSAFDYALAKKLLQEKGFDLSTPATAKLNNERLEELKKPEPSNTLWIVLGYIFAFGGGVIGFFIGWQLWKAKKTLPDGEQVYTYNDADRKNGKWIFILSILGLLTGLYYKLIVSS